MKQALGAPLYGSRRADGAALLFTVVVEQTELLSSLPLHLVVVEQTKRLSINGELISSLSMLVVARLPSSPLHSCSLPHCRRAEADPLVPASPLDSRRVNDEQELHRGSRLAPRLYSATLTNKSLLR